MASSSSAIDSCHNYDVFLSFRGEDTRYKFVSHLYTSLVDNNIKAFIDYDIRRGEEITVAIERMIEGAKMSIIVFSKRYAESTFCLDELLKIMECWESKRQIVVPIFYEVEPSEEIYEKAFKSHAKETINKRMKVERWKSAFRKALELAGMPIDNKSIEAEMIKKITTEVIVRLKEMNNSLSKGEELKGKSLVGQTAENNFKKIWKYLMKDKISRVGVYGMGGVGKTTIATRINNQLLEVANSFTHVFWLTVSKEFSIFELQSRIANKINLHLLANDDEKRRAAMIQKKLRNKKFALILDDVWDAFEIEELGIPPLVDGQKLLMTSRNRQVCERMECETIEVKPLSEKEALNLFIEESKCQINDSLGDIVVSIVKQCGGLPLAIVVIARTMRGVKQIWKWRYTLRELQKPCEMENLEIEENVYKVLKYSYDRLPNDRCRQCFLYCSLFPEDHVFEANELVDYWIGVGLIDEVESRYEELDKGNVILDELINASLLEFFGHTHKKIIKMHDVIRGMAHKNVRVGFRFEDAFERIKVLEKGESFPNSTPHYSKLKTLLLKGHGIEELPSRFFANMQNLNVLHITSNLKSIPRSINNLRSLRVLIIQCCTSLKYIPSLAELENLRDLKISMIVDLEKIPEGIERLVNLKVLEFSLNFSLKEAFTCDVFEKLSHLQILNLININDKGEPEVHALISLAKLKILYVSFYNLHKLNCYVKSGHWRRLLEYHIFYGRERVTNLAQRMYSKTMSFTGIRHCEEWEEEFGVFLPDDIQSLELVWWKSPMFYHFKNPNFVNLRSISIGRYKSRYLFTVEFAQHLLHNVQYLCIQNSDNLEEIIGREEEWVNPSNYINYPTIFLPNLKALSLLCLIKLRSIYRGRMVCPSLELIQMEGFYNIKRLPFCMEKQDNKQNPTIKLQTTDGEKHPIRRSWWNSLQWDDPDAKSMYLPMLSPSEDDDK